MICKRSWIKKTTKIKDKDLEKLCNFLVDNFFIWIHLVSETIKIHSIYYNMWRRKT